MAARNIIRYKKGEGFGYKTRAGDVTDKTTLERIEALVIPPAWEDVTISASPRSRVLAKGRDQAGRTQAIYNPSFRQKQEKKKFDRTLRFASRLPRLRKQLQKDLARRKLGKEKVLATIVTLIDQAYFRVGNEKYARENKSYGITTLRSKHTKVKGDTVIFDFIGKSGKEHVKKVTDKQIAGIVKQLDELPGQEIFRYKADDGTMRDIHSADVNAYIKSAMGDEFTAKDFRTWGGTLVATTELIAAEYSSNEKERAKIVTRIVKETAEKLGNTPAVARSSYIDPRVIAAYHNSTGIKSMRQSLEKIRPRRYLSRDEARVLHLLQAKNPSEALRGTTS
jgi:DNA topoisomerase-1